MKPTLIPALSVAMAVSACSNDTPADPIEEMPADAAQAEHDAASKPGDASEPSAPDDENRGGRGSGDPDDSRTGDAGAAQETTDTTSPADDGMSEDPANGVDRSEVTTTTTTNCTVSGDGNVVTGAGQIGGTFADPFVDGCTAVGPQTGPRMPVEETRDVGSFDGVVLTDLLKGVLQVGPSEVSLDVDSSVIDGVQTVVEAGTLTIGDQDSTATLASHEDDRVFVTAPQLKRVVASGNASWTGEVAGDAIDLESEGSSRLDLSVAATDVVTVQAMGTGSIALVGTASSVVITTSGSNRVASLLETTSAEVTASGTARVEVHATESVRVRAIAGASVTVTGNPSERDVEMDVGAHVTFD